VKTYRCTSNSSSLLKANNKRGYIDNMSEKHTFWKVSAVNETLIGDELYTIQYVGDTEFLLYAIR